MRTCEGCQDQMLEYLYDLLDENERQLLTEHMAACPACQAALQQARAQQALLAAAARTAFPAVRFVPPVEEPVSQPPSIPIGQVAGGAAGIDKQGPDAPLLPLRVPRARGRNWQRWAVAAAVLLAIGLGIPGVWLAADYLGVSRAASATETTLAQLRDQMKETATQLQSLPKERADRQARAVAEVREKQVQLNMTGPATVMAGAPAEFRLHATDLNGAPTSANLTARVLNDQGKMSDPLPVAELGDGDYRLDIPANLSARPYSHMNLLVSVNRKDGFGSELTQPLTVTQPVYVTQLTTDKPMYQPGEVVYFRSLTLDRASRRPAQEALHFHYTYTTPLRSVQEIQQGSNSLRFIQNGTEVMGPDGKPVRGVGAGMFLLPPDAPGGEYTLTVREEQNRFPPQERKFMVNTYQKPRLNKQLDFNRKTYGPGEEVQALCKAHRADGGPVKDRDVEVTVTLDGRTFDAKGQPGVKAIPFKTDAEGQVTVRFQLPAQIEKGQASLAVKFNDGANVEAIVRSIPIVVKNLQVEFFPEGGDLVAGLTNRVYFMARTPLGKPADLKGQLLEDNKPLPVMVQTLSDNKEPGVNQGLGQFEFTPVAGRSYQLRIDSPVGIQKRAALPMPVEDGVVLRADAGVLSARQALQVQVKSTRPRNLLVAVSCRGQHIGSAFLKENQTEAEIKLQDRVGGVCKITVYERGQKRANLGDLWPLAERLVYRHGSDYLHVVIRTDQAAYVPREKVKLQLQTLTENEAPAPAVIMVAVVDKSVLTLADEKTARTMPTHFLLTSEVKNTEELEYADFLLGPHPKAAQALDLLLGTHGWRRFGQPQRGQPALHPAAPVFAGRAPMANAAAGEQLVAVASVPGPAVFQAAQQAVQSVMQQYKDKAAALKMQYDHASSALIETKESPAFITALARVQSYRRFFEQLRLTAVPVTAALLVLALAALSIVNLKGLKGALPCSAVAAACAVVLVVLVRWSAPLPAEKSEFAVLGRDLPASEPAPTAPEQPDADEERAGMADLAEGLKDAKPGQSGPAAAAMRLEQAEKRPVMAPMAASPLRAKAHAVPADARRGAGGGKADRNNPVPAAENRKEANLNENEFERVQDGKGLAKASEGKAGELKTRLGAFRMQAREQAPAGKDMDRLVPDQQMAGRRQLQNGGEDKAKKRGDYQLSMPVREYAHERLPGSAEIRSDFTETLYWHPVLVLPNGKASVSFDLCDSVTSYQVLAYAHSSDGWLGASTYVFDCRLPFTLQPKTPLEVTASDKITIPLSVSNNTNEKRSIGVNLEEHTGLNLLTQPEAAPVSIAPESAARKLYHFQPSIKQGDAVLVYKGKTDGFAPDTIRTAFRVVPEGFPIVAQQSDLLEGSALVSVPLPATWIKGTLKLQAQVFPSTLADLQKGLEHLLREPNGCFEQTSTSNYPNLLILDYLRENDQSKPEVERRARELLARGYQKLTSFECLNTSKNKREGYEWFGGTAPAHEALTAYGLMQFRDMARVQDVDATMIQRTQQYLLSQRDGKGGFVRNQRALDSFGRAPEAITNAYIVWALTEASNDDDLSAELNTLGEQALTSKDPYFLSLVANCQLNRGQPREALALLKRVASLQQKDGHLRGETTSITGSGDRNLEIETTALAVLAWLKANNPAEFKKPLDKAINWIGKQRGGFGGFGSTQSTILALKALIAYTRANKRTAEAGELSLLIDGKPMLSRKFPAGVAETLSLELAEPEKILKPGTNKVQLNITGKTTFPYTVTWAYNSMQPASAEGCQVRLTTKLARNEAAEGDTVRLSVTVENLGDKGQGMATAIIGLPGGMTIPEDLKQLKEYTRLPENGKRGMLSAFEIRGRELVLYWRDLAPREVIELPIDLVCRVPGEYSGPASRAYLYYNDDHKHWVDPLRISITASK